MATLLDAFEIVKNTVSVPAASSTLASVEAPAGKKVLGGGAALNGLGANDSYPEEDGSAWHVLVVNNQMTAQDVDVYAVCVG